MKKLIRLQKLIYWIIPIGCVLLQYNAFVSSIGLLVYLALVIVTFINRGQIRIDKNLIILGVIISTQQILTVFVANNTFEMCWKTIFNIFLIIICVSLGNEMSLDDRLYRCFKITGIVLTSAVMIQSIQYYILGIEIQPIVLFNLGSEEINWLQNNRPMGFFSEVQNYCSYIMPFLVLSSFKKDWKVSIFLSIGIVLSGSSLGIGLLGIFWLIIILGSKEISGQKKFIFVSIGVIITLLFMTMSIFADSREKIIDIFSHFNEYAKASMTTKGAYSNYLRIFKAYDTYRQYPVEYKLLGTGYANTLHFVMTHGLSMNWFSIFTAKNVMANYFTTGFGVFVECGFIVGCIYYLFFIKKIMKKDMSRWFILFLLVQGFMTQTFFNGVFTFYLLVYYICSEEHNTIKIKIH